MSRIDPYHSRTGHPWEIADRHDPVVWEQGEGPLESVQLESYGKDGFLLLRDIFSREEVESMIRATDELRERFATEDRPEAVLEPGTKELRSLFRVHRYHSLYEGVVSDPRVTGPARQILGGDVYVHQSRVNLKPGFEGREFYWHSDFETWHVEDGMPRMRALSASLLLSDSLDCNGPLMVVPGSHRRYVRCPGTTPEEHFKESLRKQDIGVPPREALSSLAENGGIRTLVAPAGSVILFDCNLMHGSGGNMSPYPRNSLFVVYNSIENRLEDPFSGLPPRPVFLGER